MPALFESVRAQVSALDVAERYGLNIQHGKAPCPWHNDRHPSLSFKSGRCRCFACNNGGSSIDLAARLLGCSPLDAAKRLNQDFNLGLDENAPRPTGPTPAELRRRFQEWRRGELEWLTTLSQLYHDALSLYKPDETDELFFQALATWAKVQTRVDEIENTTYDEWRQEAVQQCPQGSPQKNFSIWGA